MTRAAPQDFHEVFPHLITARGVPRLVKTGDVDWEQVDAAFCCLPHATTQEIISQLPGHIKVVDLSADFRLKNIDTYAEWCAASQQAARQASRAAGPARGALRTL